MAPKKQTPEPRKWFDPAFIASVIGSLSLLLTLGIAWGTMTARIDNAAEKQVEAKAAIAEVNKASAKRDVIINDHSVTLAKIATQLGYVGPALERIEKKLDAKP